MGGETRPDGRQDTASGSPLCIIYSLIALLGDHHYLSVSVLSSSHVILAGAEQGCTHYCNSIIKKLAFGLHFIHAKKKGKKNQIKKSQWLVFGRSSQLQFPDLFFFLFVYFLELHSL